jgi:hypothetical protein
LTSTTDDFLDQGVSGGIAYVLIGAMPDGRIGIAYPSPQLIRSSQHSDSSVIQVGRRESAIDVGSSGKLNQTKTMAEGV